MGADIRITRSLKEASKILDIPLLDHVIIGSPSTAYPEGWFTFKAAGYLCYPQLHPPPPRGQTAPMDRGTAVALHGPICAPAAGIYG